MTDTSPDTCPLIDDPSHGPSLLGPGIGKIDAERFGVIVPTLKDPDIEKRDELEASSGNSASEDNPSEEQLDTWRRIKIEHNQLRTRFVLTWVDLKMTFGTLNRRYNSSGLALGYDRSPPWRDTSTSPQYVLRMGKIGPGPLQIFCVPLTWMILRSLHLEQSSLLDQKLQRSIPFASSATKAIEKFPRASLIVLIHLLSLSVIAILTLAASMNGRTYLYGCPFCILSLMCGLLSWSHIGGSPLEFFLLFVPSTLSIEMTLGLLTERKVITWPSPPLHRCDDSEQRSDSQDDTLEGDGLVKLSSSGEVEQDLHVPAVTAYPNLVQTEGSHKSALITSAAYSSKVLDNIKTLHEVTKAANLYWCTICEDRCSYKIISDWRKHEKGHVDTYVCMLMGPVDKADGYVTCSLCGLSNPNEQHLSAHKTHTCGPGVPGSFFCKRRVDLIRHTMKCHGVQTKARAEAIADMWKETTKKQACSCGFCVCPLSTFGDRLKHIAAHFERGQTLDDWDTTNVIEGLVLQPRLINVWERPLDWRSSNGVWKKDAVKKVQHNLELGPSNLAHAKALVIAVYSARLYAWQLPMNDRHFSPAPNYEAQGTNAFSPTSGHSSM